MQEKCRREQSSAGRGQRVPVDIGLRLGVPVASFQAERRVLAAHDGLLPLKFEIKLYREEAIHFVFHFS